MADEPSPRRSPLQAAALFAFLGALLVLSLVPDASILRPKLAGGRGLMILSGALLLLDAARTGRLVGRWGGVVVAGLLPGLLALLHPLHTEVASPALARDEIERLVLLPLVMGLVACLVRGPKDRDRVVLVLALAGVAVGSWALVERLGGWFGWGVDPHHRAMAGFGNPVFLGAWLVLVTPLMLAEALAGPTATRWLAALAAGVCLPALLATDSAGAWLGFGAALVLALILTSRNRRTLVWVLGSLVLLGSLVIVTNMGVLLRPRAHTLIWLDTLSMALTHPGGVGPGQFQLAFLPFASQELLDLYPRSSVIINDAHSEPLQILAELGWAGLLATLAALFVALRALREVLAAPSASDAARLVAVLTALGGAMLQSFVSPDLRFTVSVLLFASLAGVAASYAPATTVSLGRATRLGCVLLSLLGLAFVGREALHRTRLSRLADPGGVASPAADVGPRVGRARRAVARDPDDPSLHFELGAALHDARQEASAAQAFRDALALSPGNATVIRALGLVEALAGQFDAAVPHLRAALEVDPDDAAARYQLAFASFGRGDLVTAVAEVEELLRRHPDHERGHLLLERLRE